MYKAREAAEILGVSVATVFLYRKKYGVGTLESPRRLLYSDSDIAFLRTKIKKSEKREAKKKEASEYERALKEAGCELITQKQLAEVLGISLGRVDVFEGFGVLTPPKTDKARSEYKKIMFRVDDIPKIKAAMRDFSSRKGARGSYNKGEHSSEYLERIKQKYAAGVPEGEIEKWILGI